MPRLDRRILLTAMLCAMPWRLPAVIAEEAYAKGVDKLAEKDWKGAESVFRHVIEDKKDYAEAYNKLGLALHNQGRMMEAIEAFKQAKTIDPRLTEAWYHLGLAFESVDKDVTIKKEDDKARKKLAKTKAQEAVAAYRRALDIQPVNDARTEANTHFRLGVVLRDEEMKKAEAAKDAGQAGKPNLKEAMVHLEKAVDLTGDFPEARNELGRVYDIIGRYPEAVAQYTQAIQGHQFFAEAYSNRGVAYWKDGNWDRALEDCRKAIEIDPKFAGGQYNFAEVVFARVDEIKNGPDRSLIHLEVKKAIDSYRVATELDPGFLPAWYGLAKAYHAYFDYENAEKTYAHILEMDKKQKGAKAKLKELAKEHKSLTSHVPKEYQKEVKK
jgi:tetratricopeptide (TPR) repeat protein